MTRDQLVARLAHRIVQVKRPHPVRVAIDGVDAAGKTTLADELVPALERVARPVIRASIDGFHNPAAIRYGRGVDAVLLFDGVFLLGPDLRPFWDCSIFVRADFEVTVARAEIRDRERFGSASIVRQRYEQRYVPGQQLYLSDIQPERHATVVGDNNDPMQPRLEERVL